MRNVICTIILWGLTQLSFAEVSCVRPSLSATIYFNNGIKTDVRSAKASRAALEAASGTDYNGHALDYAIAYNETSGMAVDLAQATAQSGFQNNKNILRWLNGKNLAPEWFLNWFDKYLFNRSMDVAKETASHANFYLNDILHGKKLSLFRTHKVIFTSTKQNSY